MHLLFTNKLLQKSPLFTEHHRALATLLMMIIRRQMILLLWLFKRLPLINHVQREVKNRKLCLTSRCLRWMVVDYVIDAKEPNFVGRVILLDHVPD